MGNCLVTQLKGVVDNDNLPKLNTFEITIPAGTTGEVFYVGRAAGGDVKVSWEGTDPVYTVTPYETPRVSPIILKNDYSPLAVYVNGNLNPIKFTIEGVYYLYALRITMPTGTEEYPEVKGLRASMLNAADLLQYICIENYDFPATKDLNLEGLNITKMIQNIMNDPHCMEFVMRYFSGKVSLNLDQLVGSIENFSRFIVISRNTGHQDGITGNISRVGQLFPSLPRFQFNDTNIYGSINGLGADSNLSYLICPRSNVSGSVEAFAEGWYSRPNKTQQYAYLEVHNTSVTFNGINVSTPFYLTLDNGTLSVRANSVEGHVVATYDGSTWTYA